MEIRTGPVVAMLGLAVAQHAMLAQSWYPSPCEASYGPSSYLGDGHIVDAVNHPPILFTITAGYTRLSSGGDAASGYSGTYATNPAEPRRKFTLSNGPYMLDGVAYKSIDSTWAWQNARVQLTQCVKADVPDGEIVRATIPMNAASGTAVMISAIWWRQLDEEECVPINHSGDCAPPTEPGGDTSGDQWYMCSYLVSYYDGHEISRELIGCTPF